MVLTELILNQELLGLVGLFSFSFPMLMQSGIKRFGAGVSNNYLSLLPEVQHALCVTVLSGSKIAR